MFGPPQNFTSASSCSWLGHPVSGLRHATHFAHFRLAFASAPVLYTLTSQHIVTRRPVLQKVRGHACSFQSVALPLLVSIWFQVLFHSPPGVLFTFPSRYLSLWVIRSYLALGDGPPAFPRNFSCSMVLFNRWLAHNADYRAFTSFGPGFHAGSSTVSFAYLCHKVFLPRFWALTFSLATTRVIVGLLSLPPGT